MSASLVIFSGIAVLLGLLLVWLLRDQGKSRQTDGDLNSADEFHATYFPQVRRAMSQEDLAFLTLRGSARLSRRVRKERQKIALAYLTCLRKDFGRRWRLARVIAVMSPRVGMAQELSRFRLGLAFCLRYELVRFKFVLGRAPLPDLSSLSETVSKLAVRLEKAMNELGERAALATELASTLNGRGVNPR